MAESNSVDPSKIPSTSAIPPEMIPLLAEIEAQGGTDKFITVALPMDDGPGSSERTITETETPMMKTRLQRQKFHSSTKSKQKRKKMEVYVREHKQFVHVGNQLKRWDQYRKELRIRSDEEFAKLLLDGFRKYTKVVQLIVGPTFGYPEMVPGEDGKDSLGPLNKVEHISDSDDLPDFIRTVKEGVAAGRLKEEFQAAGDNIQGNDEGAEGEGSPEENGPKEGT